MTQCEIILKHMKEHGEISQRDAYKYGCTRLAARIADLRRRGWVINSDMRKVKRMDGTTVYVSFYRLEDKI